MKRAVTIFITLLMLAVVTLIGLEWMARLEDKHPGEVRFSASEEESKRNNFFESAYRPLYDTLKLSQRASVIIFHSAFAERGWRIDTSTFYLLHKKIPADIYNVVINYSEAPATTGFHFDLVPVTDSNYSSGLVHYGNHLLLHRIAALPDTLWFNVRETSADSTLGWVETESLVAFTRNTQAAMP